MLEIAGAAAPQDYAEARRLMCEYAGSIGIDLGFQHFDDELASVERVYGPPGGCLLLARRDGGAVGCVAVRRLDEDTCEMKRLYVLPSERGSGAGRALAEAVIAEAKRMGYRRMRLDTLATMTAARALYRTLGFHEIEPYYENPHPTVFMQRELS